MNTAKPERTHPNSRRLTAAGTSHLHLPYAVLLILALAAGCGGSNTPNTQEPSQPNSPQTAQVPTDVGSEPSPPANADPTESSASVAEQSAPEPTETAAAENDADAETVDEQPEPATVVRFLLFAPGGPLVVDIGLMLDGEPADRQMDQLVARILEAADADGDGTATWEEVTTNPKFMYGQFGNASMPSDHARNEVISRCDRNHDGVLNPEEVPRFVTQAGADSEVFSFTQAFRAATNDCWEWLNTVKDGILTDDELAAAPDRLRSRDGDDDELLLAAEMRDEMPTAMRRPNRRLEMAVVLEGSTDWDLLLVKLEDRYGNPLAAESFPLVPDLFERLDADADGSLDDQEAAALAEVPAHLELEAVFGATPEDPASGASLELKRMDASLAETVKVLWERGDGVSLRLPGAKMVFSVSDRLAGNDEEAIKRQFAAYDNDGNGYLDEKEAAAARPAFMAPLEAADTDSDGKVYLQEAVAYQQRRQAFQRCRIRGTTAEHDDALFAALDADDDGRLGAREIAASAGRLRSFDADGDGRLTANELPANLLVQFTRGDAPMGMAMRADTYAAAAPPAPDAPRWFTAMDVNADGDISPREFLGTTEQFQSLDANADGFIDLNESAPN